MLSSIYVGMISSIIGTNTRSNLPLDMDTNPDQTGLAYKVPQYCPNVNMYVSVSSKFFEKIETCAPPLILENVQSCCIV